MRNTIKILGICMIFTTLTSGSMSTEKAKVCLKVKGCDYIILCTQSENYCLVEDTWGNCESEDILVGDFKSYGYKTFYNLTKDKEVKVYIDDWQYSEKSIIEKWKNKCK